MSIFGNVWQGGYLQFIEWDLDKSRDPNLTSTSQIWNFVGLILTKNEIWAIQKCQILANLRA